MITKIASVQPLGKSVVLVWFAGGEVRRVSLGEMASSEQGSVSPDGLERASRAATVAEDGGYVVWGNGVRTDAEELYAVGQSVDPTAEECDHILQEVVETRHGLGISQAKLAMAAGVKQPVVARLETGVNSPRIDTLLKILTPMGKTLRVKDL